MRKISFQLGSVHLVSTFNGVLPDFQNVTIHTIMDGVKFSGFG